MMLHQPITCSDDWYRKSGVLECERCEGKGSYWNGRGLGGNDPDSWAVDCEACDAQGYHPCDVCGFDQHIGALDCLVCDTLHEMTGAEIAQLEPIELAAAFTRGIAAALGHPGKADLFTLMRRASDASEALRNHDTDDAEWDRLSDRAAATQQALHSELARLGLAKTLTRAIQTGVIW